MNDLGCSCTIDGYGGSPADDFHEFVMKSNKDHVCIECQETIPAGTPHEYVRGCWEGDYWATYRTCITCRNVRNSYCCTWQYGHLEQTLWDELGLNYITGELAYEDEDD